jgi:hypothetical protein
MKRIVVAGIVAGIAGFTLGFLIGAIDPDSDRWPWERKEE